MPFAKTDLTNTAWTLIGNNVTNITFQNAGSMPIYINATSTNTAPTETVGLIYIQWTGETNKDVTTLTKGGGTYIWARSIQATGGVIVES